MKHRTKRTKREGERERGRERGREKKETQLEREQQEKNVFCIFDRVHICAFSPVDP